MGFNIAGLVISKNFEKSIENLENDLSWDIEVIEEITFEEAASNWTPEGEFRLFFTERGTMIFYPHEWISEQYSSKSATCMSYAYSATSMTFFISYNNLEEGYGRFLIENDGEVKLAEGQEIPYEKEGLTADAIIFKLMDDIIGESWHNLEFGAKAYRCKKLNSRNVRHKKKEETIIEKVEAPPIENKILQKSKKTPTRPTAKVKWWQFWK